MSTKFNSIFQQYSTSKEFIFFTESYEGFTPETFDQLLSDMNTMKTDVLDNTDKKYGLAYFEIIAESTAFTFYFYVDKSSNPAADPHEIGLFCLTMSNPINS